MYLLLMDLGVVILGNSEFRVCVVQVELRLKVLRGRSVRSVIVQEAKACGSAKVIVGISRSNHTIRSPAAVARYCARNLPRSFSVFAVDNGKVVFQRDAANTCLGRSKGVKLLLLFDEVRQGKL